jgi:hypothetical protein
MSLPLGPRPSRPSTSRDPRLSDAQGAGEAAMKVEDIDRFLDRWRATLTPAFAPEYVDGFMRRHRGELHALVLKTLARRGAEGGEAPELLADFLAYDVVAAAQRSVDAQPDAQVLRELWRHVDAQFAQGYNELSVFPQLRRRVHRRPHRGDLPP